MKPEEFMQQKGEFLMYRVELKAKQDTPTVGAFLPEFLMYRVELKEQQGEDLLKKLTTFLMYRVELKVIKQGFN